jgi:hypothetical protein
MYSPNFSSHSHTSTDTISISSTEQPHDSTGQPPTISVTDYMMNDGDGKQYADMLFPVRITTQDDRFPIVDEKFTIPTKTVSSSSSSSASSSPKLKGSLSCTSISSTRSTILDPTSPYQNYGRETSYLKLFEENIAEGATYRPLKDVKDTPACKALLKRISSSLPLRMKRVGDYLEEWLGELTYKPEPHGNDSLDDKYRVGAQSFFFTHTDSAEDAQSENSPPKLASPRKCNLVSKVTKVLNIKKKPPLDTSYPFMMILKPPLTKQPVSQFGKLFKLPLTSQSRRIIFLRDQKIETYQDNEHGMQKEVIQINDVSSIQRLIPQVSAEGETIYCFEITFKLPKPFPTTQGCSKTDTTRLSYIFGSEVQSTASQWMHWILESMTVKFLSYEPLDYLRAGWCYIKRSLTSDWLDAWILLTDQRNLLFADGVTEEIDLRKMRLICPTNTEDSIDNLYVDKGPIMLIDCPPCTFYVVFPSVFEASTWTELIKKEAHKNGRLLKEQQLTKDDVPVVVDKCVNYIYANGSRKEGIYHKPGSLILTEKLLKKFREDAFSVYGCPPGTDVNVVASCLKKFMRDLSKPLIGDLAVDLIHVSSKFEPHF